MDARIPHPMDAYDPTLCEDACASTSIWGI